MFQGHRLFYRIIDKTNIKSYFCKVMTRVRRRLIEDFLLPALNDCRYGDRLKWENKEKNCFSIRWSHKNAAKWSLEDTVVFQDWDKMKGHYKPDCKGYYMQAKQRFRAALYKLATVKVLKSDDKHVKKYELVLDNGKRKHLDNDMSKERNKKFCPIVETGQRSIPTSVICRNDSYYERQLSYDCVPQSLRVSIKSDYSDNSNDDSLESPDNSNPVKHEIPNENNVAEPSNRYCFTKPIDNNLSGYINNTIIAKPTNNFYEMVQIKSEPIDSDYEMVPIKCEPENNIVMVPVKYVCELDFSEDLPIKEEPVSNSEFRTMLPTPEKINVTESKVEPKVTNKMLGVFTPKWWVKYLAEESKTSHKEEPLSEPEFRTMPSKPEKPDITDSKVEPKVTNEMQSVFTPKWRIKYLGERSKISHDGKTKPMQPEVPILSKQFVPKVEKSENSSDSFLKAGFHTSDETCPILSKVENSTMSVNKTTSVPVNNRINPHVPIPPLPGYSKHNIAVKPLDSHRRIVFKQIKGNYTGNKFMFESQDKWSVSEPTLSADGALNLCTKSYKNEKYSCADR